MSDFHELMMPSHTNGVTPELWYVEAVQVTQFLLNTKIDLGTTAEPIESFYFTSEKKAFDAISAYYALHGEPFPYFSQWSDALDREANGDTIDTTKVDDEVDSQIMRFE